MGIANLLGLLSPCTRKVTLEQLAGLMRAPRALLPATHDAAAKEQEAGALAMAALHRQTLPFILRRVKEDVLADLPPKITQHSN